jgi:hypothetical protein
MKRALSIIILVLLFSEFRSISQDIQDQKHKTSAGYQKSCLQIVGVDHFGRSFSTVSGLKTEKQVGLFFFEWIGQPYASGIYDAAKILAMPNGLKLLTDFNFHDSTVSPNGQAHYWGEPLWGYYNSDDEWVIRKQLQMITMAGVDFIFFDATNSLIYKSVFMKILGILDEYQKAGWDPPRVAFYTHSHSLQTTRTLYRELYEPNVYPDTWYRINGKPMIIAYTKPEDDLAEAKSRGDSYTTGPLPDEILNFFYFFIPQWPFEEVRPDGFPWVEWTFPQPLHGHMMNVTVASHPAIPMSFSLTRGNQNWGRGWNTETKQNVEQDIDKGTFFQSQWDHALAVDPDMISVGGWNEWIAYKQPYLGEYMLCDGATKEFSRDIEPMNGGYQDAFYIQLIRNIRKYKGVIETAETSESKTIDISRNISQWDGVTYTQENIDGIYPDRDSYGGAKAVHYTQPAPANKLKEIKVSHDSRYLYFYIRFRDKITPFNGKDNWLNLLIGTGDPGLKNWESYEYIIGTRYEGNKTDVGRLHNDFTATKCGEARYFLNDSIIQIRVPRSAIKTGAGENQFYFKVAAGVDNPSGIMNYYRSGSVMPMGRLSYIYYPGK